MMNEEEKEEKEEKEQKKKMARNQLRTLTIMKTISEGWALISIYIGESGIGEVVTIRSGTERGWRRQLNEMKKKVEVISMEKAKFLCSIPTVSIGSTA